jgi:hypothetical protein
MDPVAGSESESGTHTPPPTDLWSPKLPISKRMTLA